MVAQHVLPTDISPPKSEGSLLVRAQLREAERVCGLFFCGTGGSLKNTVSVYVKRM
jgi:hypothetical protein